jgi:hypothetical protein
MKGVLLLPVRANLQSRDARDGPPCCLFPTPKSPWPLLLVLLSAIFALLCAVCLCLGLLVASQSFPWSSVCMHCLCLGLLVTSQSFLWSSLCMHCLCLALHAPAFEPASRAFSLNLCIFPIGLFLLSMRMPWGLPLGESLLPLGESHNSQFNSGALEATTAVGRCNVGIDV